ncbi:hypothetical protein COB21_05945 [Candidatus Aerophobetes bacterium]|uniref:Flagellar motor switch protein FliN-like C-terminal domain-containing protein n=1 Tax=Aerophobetes bacterium TaxID=2030807 RepID=A0A2A4WY79_UNCAE|nr:MAG: hypothetical protein COB21_05945 [Candidatus Aerophobetes bacterium]
MTKETSWIKQVESAVKEAELIPMLGSIPPFPKEAFLSTLKKALDFESLDIDLTGGEWKHGDEVTDGLGQNLFQTAIQLTPLKGSCSLLMPQEDFSKLSAFLVDKKKKANHFLDPFLQKGFFKYICLESLSAIVDTGYLQDLSPKVIDMPFSKENAYCVDLSIRLKKTRVWARVLIPSMLQKNIATHFSSNWSYQMHSPLYQSINLPLSLTIGEVKLDIDQWDKINEGDLLILDHTSFNPETGKGLLSMQLHRTPLFLVKLKNHKLKIIDYALENSMKPTDPSGSPLEENMENTPDASDQKEHKPSTRGEKLTPANKVPLTLIVEAAKIQLTLEQLLTLKPGNILDTTLSPDTEVSLTLEGKSVAKGVLIQYGDVTGIKLTSLG